MRDKGVIDITGHLHGSAITTIPQCHALHFYAFFIIDYLIPTSS